MSWPNNENWAAEINDLTVQSKDGHHFVWTIDCGELSVPSGKLVACDPFAMMSAGNNPFISIPPGRYPVSVTLADVSKKQDRSHIREAYMTLRVAPGTGAYRRVLPLLLEGQEAPELAEGEFCGFGVDAWTACFVDNDATLNCMPNPDDWLEDLFENDDPKCWFSLMDNPEHIRDGIANIPLPLAKNGENIIVVHSGWGDGSYPVIGLYDSNDQLIAVHVDFAVIR